MKEKVPEIANVAPLVLSVTETFEYTTDTKVTVCPLGQEKPTSLAVAGDSVNEPTMFPLLFAVKLPDALPCVWVVVLLLADGFLPPLFTHS